MYNFIDTTEVSEGKALPSEALQINGEYIENLINGYRTLQVEGREALSPEIKSYETGIRDGSTMQGKRYPARTITVTYQIATKSNEEFRAAYNKLAGILDVKDAQLIFNDETDKFFVGTPSGIGDVKPGLNSVVGEFEITCFDPFKYSVIEYEARPDLEESSVMIDYNGTYKSFPTLEASFFNENEASEDGETEVALTGSGDCGFVAFFNDNEKIIQLGDPDEVDGDSSAYAKSQTLVNSSFKTSSAWGSAAKKQWNVNSGTTSSSSVEQAGSIAMGEASSAVTSVKTSNTQKEILNIVSNVSSPYIRYKIVGYTSERKATSVKVKFNITSSLAYSGNLFGRGFGLRAYISFNTGTEASQQSKSVVLKPTGDRWTDVSAHTVSVSFTVTGLSANATSIKSIKFRVVREDDNQMLINGGFATGGTAGTLSSTGCADLPVSAYTTSSTAATYYLTPSAFGSGSNWHGPSITRVIPADATGDIGATDFTLSYSQKMSIGSGKNDTAQLGAFQVLLVNKNGTSKKIVAGVNVYKGSSGKKAKLRFYLNGTVMETMDVDLSYNNKYFNSSNSSTITKSGQTVTFNICGIKKTFRSSDIANIAVTEVTFTLSKSANKTPLSYNGLYWVKFVKNNCDTWKDIPNKFSANDVVEAECTTGTIRLNGVSAPELGALGNDWEGFYLTPGVNQIGITYSDWVAAGYEPTFKVKYREVFL